MAAYKGSLVLIRIGDGNETETFTTLGGLRVASLRLANHKVEAGHVGSGAWRTLMAHSGLRSLTVAGNGVFSDETSEERLRAQAFSGAVSNYELRFGNGDMLQGVFMVGSYERTGKMGDVETYALVLESAGEVSFTRA